jgi:hypothetical protein
MWHPFWHQELSQTIKGNFVKVAAEVLHTCCCLLLLFGFAATTECI